MDSVTSRASHAAPAVGAARPQGLPYRSATTATARIGTSALSRNDRSGSPPARTTVAPVAVARMPTRATSDGARPIVLREDRIRIEARDDSTATPSPSQAEMPTRHRGPFLIEELSEEWAVNVERHDGNVVCCEVRAT